MYYENLLYAIGSTPLVKVPFDTPATVLAKLEYLNPGGSIKDRSAYFMVEEAIRTGKLKPGGTIIEASSGNQGISIAMIGAIKGYKTIITVSEKVSKEKQATLVAYGAQIVVCKPTEKLDDPEGYYATAECIHKETPNSFFVAQYYNTENARSHYYWTGPEIWQQTHGTVTHVVLGAGSCGTICGAGKYLKERNPNIKVIGVDTSTSWLATKGSPKPYKVEGLGVDYPSPHLAAASIDDFINVSDENAFAMLKKLARTYGFLVGPATGAIAYAAEQYAKTLTPKDVVVTIFTDSGRAYLTKGYY